MSEYTLMTMEGWGAVVGRAVEIEQGEVGCE